MIRKQVVVVDYGLGNQSSVQRVVRNLGHYCAITDNKDQISCADLVILPGVGAFPAAMKNLHQRQLIPVLTQRANINAPILGICLGMQLLTDSSEELGTTQGLGLIPGRIKLLNTLRWHIGWSTLEIKVLDTVFYELEEQAFYFNHSYVYEGSDEFVMALANADETIPAIIRRGHIAGVQFHPEKSQEAGRLLLANLIDSLCGIN